MVLQRIQQCQCGSNAIKEADSGLYVCEYCGAKYIRGLDVKDSEYLIEHIEKAQLRETAKLIEKILSNLDEEVHKKYLNNEEIVYWCKELERLVPQHFWAEFYKKAVADDKRELSEFINSIDINYHYGDMDEILRFSIRCMRKRNEANVSGLIYRVYESREHSKFEQWMFEFKKRAEEIDDGIYNPYKDRDVFVVHASEDREEALRLVNLLEENGYECFISERNLEHGTNKQYEENIRIAIAHCAVVLFLSTNYSRDDDRDSIRLELEYVIQKDVDVWEKSSEYDSRILYERIADRYKKQRIQYRQDGFSRQEQGYVDSATVKKFFGEEPWVKNDDELLEKMSKLHDDRITAKPILDSKGNEHEVKAESNISDEQRSNELCQIAWNCYKSQRYKEAFNNWVKAAELGSPVAKYNVGWCYENECYVTYDIEKAIGYYVAADALGNEEAKKALERIRAKREQEQARLQKELTEQRRRAEEAHQAKIAAEQQRQQAEEETRKAKEEAEQRAKEAEKIGIANQKDSQRFTLEQRNKNTQERALLVEKALRGTSGQNTTQQLADYPTLQNYDKSEFEISGTTLVKYLGHNERVQIPYGVTCIGKGAFSSYDYCKNIINIEIPNSMTKIEKDAFSGCSIIAIKIPNSVRKIEAFACHFYRAVIYCEAMSKPLGWSKNWNRNSFYKGSYYRKAFSSFSPVVWNCNNNEKDEDGYVYTIIDEIIYALKDGIATVIGSPRNLCGDVTIPSKVTYNGMKYTVTVIEENAFSHKKDITSISLPASIKKIGEFAFMADRGWGWASIITIHYEGSKSQWHNIETVYNNLYRDALYFCIHCNDGTIDRKE